MANPANPSRAYLERIRDVAFVTYTKCYIQLMATELGVDISDDEAINHMVMQMIEPLNLGAETAWCALMKDEPGMVGALDRFRESLNRV